MRRIIRHRTSAIGGFTSKYRSHHLVYCEAYDHVGTAIHREKRRKAGRRKKKSALIEAVNPTRLELVEDRSLKAKMEIPRLAALAWDDKTVAGLAAYKNP